MGKGESDDVKPCDPEEVALKSFFLGPQAENAGWVQRQALRIFGDWIQWRRSLFSEDGAAISKQDQTLPEFKEDQQRMSAALHDLLQRFRGELPSFSPRYIGHMMSEISIPALLGHVVTLLHNPNNITREVSFVGSEIEREAVEALAEMLGYQPSECRGHFTSGGTLANIEGLVRARARLARWLAVGTLTREQGKGEDSLFDAAHCGWQAFDKVFATLSEGEIRARNFLHSNPFVVARLYEKAFGKSFDGPVVLVPASKHYSWPKGVTLLGLGSEAFWPIELNKKGEASVSHLQDQIYRARADQRPIIAVVSVAGTTELGDFDPVHKITDLLERLRIKEGWDIWHHVDAAYGGFFRTLPRESSSPASQELFAALDGIPASNSITIDPHKLGYVPYASGAFLVRKTREYYVTPFDAPYLRFEQSKQVGTQTLEGSRSAAGAVATWLTAKSIGLNGKGYGLLLERTIRQRKLLEEKLKSCHPCVRIAPHSETNILCFCVAAEGDSLAEANRKTEKLYALFSQETEDPFYVSLTRLRFDAYREYLKTFSRSWNTSESEPKADELALVRLTLMNPFFDSHETSVRYPEVFTEKVLSLIKTLT